MAKFKLNGYDLSRKFINWAFENPSKIKPNHYALYFFSIEHCNRLGWKKEFGLPSIMSMEATGIKSHNTYMKTFNDLIEFGFFNCIERSKNQYSSNIIALSNFDEAHNKALDEASIKHYTKQSGSTIQSIDNINKPITINNKQINKEEDSISKATKIKNFLMWFNNSKKIHLGKEGLTGQLSSTDINNLFKLRKCYGQNQFDSAFKNMCKSNWAAENNMVVPAHFLRNDNFDKYLNQESDVKAINPQFG